MVRDSEQPFNKVKTGLHSIAAWIGSPRSDGGVPEDLLDNPELDSIQFVSLSPISGTPGQLQSFALLTDEWVRRNCDPFVYTLAEALDEAGNVKLLDVQQERIQGVVLDARSYLTELRIYEAGATGACNCEKYGRHVAVAEGDKEWLPCEHLAALAISIIRTQVVPKPSVSVAAVVCPVTRQQLDANKPIYRCSRCQLSYSTEGWQFIKQMDRGRCCGCRSKNTIHLQPAGGE